MAEKSKTIRKTYTTYTGPGDLFTVEEQIDQCCEEVDVDICADVGKTEIYTAADSEKWNAKLEELKAKYPHARIVVKTVGPQGPCGKKYTRWTESRGCCDGVPAISWNEDESGDVVAQNSSVTVSVTGDKMPRTVEVIGSGFWLDYLHTIKDGSINSNQFKIYADSTACGSAVITVSDGCSTVEGTVRSTVGRWVIDPSGSGCVGGAETTAGCSGNCTIYTYTNGGRKQEQWINLNDGSLVCGSDICTSAYDGDFWPHCPSDENYCWCVYIEYFYKWVC